jgi:peroxiredoxin
MMDARDDQATIAPTTETDPESPAVVEPEEAEDLGRIGYGRYGRWTPFALALLLIVTLLAIGIANQRRHGSADSGTTLLGGSPVAGVAPGAPAPDFSMNLFDGQPLRLSDLRGKVVVLNFWASWCDPCKREMPAYQAVAADAGSDVRIVGIGLKNDKDADARAFAEKYGVTYPIGRDAGGASSALLGPIETAYGINFAPTTIVIHPDGTVSAVALGPQTEDRLRALIKQARE